MLQESQHSRSLSTTLDFQSSIKPINEYLKIYWLKTDNKQIINNFPHLDKEKIHNLGNITVNSHNKKQHHNNNKMNDNSELHRGEPGSFSNN